MLLVASNSSTLPLSVAELEARHEGLTGQTVEVQGRLAECQPLSCGLLGDSIGSGVTHWLSFAPDDVFDRAAGALVGHRVVVEGVVLDTCWPPRAGVRGGGKPVIRAFCTDRGPQFKAVRIVRDLGQS